MTHNNDSYYFGPYCLIPAEGVLLREGKPISLAPKAFDTLLVLVRNSGHLVEKDDLMREVWPETCVEESNLTQNIHLLRKVLGETLNGPKYIETVSRRGYRFVAPVRQVSDGALVPEMSTVRHQVDVNAPSSQPDPPARFIAVLPFVNASDDPNVEYLSVGITESIIKSLSQLPQLRVMSRSTVFRYKGREADALQIGKDLGVEAVLVGRVHVPRRRLIISAELVDVANGWQLWGENYDRGSGDIFEVQEEIARQISATLRLKLTGEQEQRLTQRFTESAEAYRSYLQGRYYWSTYTKEGLKQAIVCFRQAIELDGNYALAYASIVDCYLRLATNYILSESSLAKTPANQQALETGDRFPPDHTSSGMVKVRYEWDQKAAERELKRAIQLKSNYPAAHQWHAAYLFSLDLYQRTLAETNQSQRSSSLSGEKLSPPNQYVCPTEAEEVQVFCTIAREQIEVGNYEASCAVLQRWWNIGEWPRLDSLSPQASADLLFTAGVVAGCVASTRQVPRGQKHAEALLNGSIAIFEQLGSRTRSAEGQIELGTCYFREGMFDMARNTLQEALNELAKEDRELRAISLIRLAVVERQAGRLHDSLHRLTQAEAIVNLVGPSVTGRYHQELATTLKDLGIAENCKEYLVQALSHYQRGLHDWEAIGNHRFVAALENNRGHLLMTLGHLDEAEAYLMQARSLFDGFVDRVRRAQVDETLARLHIAAERFDLAYQAADRAVQTLQKGGEGALLAEALTTQGLVLCRLGRRREAKRVLDRASRVAETCGDSEGAGLALLVIIEQMGDQLDDVERLEMAVQLQELLASSQQALICERIRRALN